MTEKKNAINISIGMILICMISAYVHKWTVDILAKKYYTL